MPKEFEVGKPFDLKIKLHDLKTKTILRFDINYMKKSARPWLWFPNRSVFSSGLWLVYNAAQMNGAMKNLRSKTQDFCHIS